MGKLYTILFALLAVASVLSGCTTIADAFRAEQRVDSSVVATWWDGPRIRPGIALDIEAGTNGAVEKFNLLVDQNGDITLSGSQLLLEPISCDGLTLEALKQKLIEKYKVYINTPVVTVKFAPYDGKGVSPYGTVTVMGEVGNPGPVNMPATMDLTVTKILKEAGGLKPFADKTNIQVSRCDKDGVITQTRINLNEIGKGGRIDKDMSLRPGDVVYVFETWY